MKFVVLYAGCVALLPSVGCAQSRGHYFRVAQQAYLAGDQSYARAMMEALLHSTPGEDDLRLVYRGLDAIDSIHPLNFKMFGAIQPSSNINGASSSRAFITPSGQFNIVDRPKSGIGYRIGASGSYRSVIGPGLRFTSALKLTRVHYPDLNRLDRWIAEPSLSLSKEFPQLTLGTRIYLRRSWHDIGPQTETTTGLTLSAKWIESADLNYGALLGWERITRDNEAYYNGALTHLDLSVTRRVIPQARVSIGLRLEGRSANNRHLGYKGAKVSLTGDYMMNPINLFDFSLSYEQRDHDVITPGTGIKRRDQRYSVGAGWTNGTVRFFGAAPRMGCVYSQTRSNLSLYSTQSTNCALSLVKQF